MTIPTPTLQLIDESTIPVTVMFDFNDGVNTSLTYKAAIPYPDYTSTGDKKLARGIRPGYQDRQNLNLSIAFQTLNIPRQTAADLQAALHTELEKPRHVLKYNPDPANLPDVFFDTYASPDSMAFDALWHISGVQDHNIKVLADPFARLDEKIIFDSTTMLFECEGSGETWAGTNPAADATNFIYGSQSEKSTPVAGSSSSLAVALSTPRNLSSYWSTGWVTMWMYLDTVPNDLAIWISIGSDASNYRKWGFVTFVGGWGQQATFVPGWQIVYFDFNSGYATTGVPNLSAIDWLEIYVGVPWGQTAPIFNVDNCTISNGPVCAPRARAPFVFQLNNVETLAPAGMLLKTKLSSNINRLWIGKKEKGVDPFPAVVDTPAADDRGEFSMGTLGQSASCHKGDYYRYSVSNAGILVHPGKFYFHQHEGRYKVLARVRTYDAGTVSINWTGYDKNNSDYGSGEVKQITALGNAWQVIDLGEVGVPLHGFPADATPSAMYTALGLWVVGSAGAANFDVDYVCTFPVDGGGRVILPPTALAYLNIDTRHIGSQGVYGSTDGTADSSYGLGHRSRGDLKTLDPGVNNIAVMARDTATPALVPDVEITKVSYIPRVPVSAN